MIKKKKRKLEVDMLKICFPVALTVTINGEKSKKKNK